MAKGKSKGASAGPKKMHKGPKRKLFKEFKPMITAFARAGVLDKFNNYESWCLACNARGKRDTNRQEFSRFFTMNRKEKEEFFRSIKK